MESVFDHVLTAPLDAPAPRDIPHVWNRHRELAARFDAPVDVAVAGGFGVDRLGYAFLSGYQAALRALVPELGDGMVALSATEAGGAHPAAIRTVLTETGQGWTVEGTKTFTTLGTVARQLVVIARSGTDGSGRPALRAVLVDTDSPGVTVIENAAPPFAPEIPHATVELVGVASRLLPGDGYTDYLKPFRTSEDIHVLAATLGWLAGVARRAGWPPPATEQILALVAAVRGLASAPPTSAGIHIALAGLFERLTSLLSDLEPLWTRADPAERERWERDRPLLATAGRVRALRLEAAWRRVGDMRAGTSRQP